MPVLYCERTDISEWNIDSYFLTGVNNLTYLCSRCTGMQSSDMFCCILISGYKSASALLALSFQWKSTF